MKTRVITFTSLLALLIAMVATTSAFAQSSPGQDVYNPNGEVLDVLQGGGTDTVPPPSGGVRGVVQGGGTDTAPSGATKNQTHSAPVARENGTAPASAPAVAKGELPFTGFQAGLVALAGLALLGTGVAMRRVSRSDDAS